MALNLMDALRRDGHDLLAVTASLSDGEFGRRLKQIGVPEVQLPFGTFSKRLNLRALKWTVHTMLELPRVWFGWARLHRNFRPDILILTGPKQGIFLYPWLGRQPSILLEHSIKAVNWGNRCMYAALARALKIFVATSEFMAQHLFDLGISPAQIRVIKIGSFFGERRRQVCAAAPAFRSNDAPLEIGIAGQISPHKGHGYLLRAAIMLKARRKKFLVRVFGAGNEAYIRRLKSEVAAADLEDHWIWMGYEADLARIYTSFGVCVVPSCFDEPFGMVAVEASAYGLPVIASRCGGLPEIVREGETGWLVEPRNAEQLANRICWFIDHPEEQIRFGRAARAHAFEVFGLEATLVAFKSLFDSLATPAGNAVITNVQSSEK